MKVAQAAYSTLFPLGFHTPTSVGALRKRDESLTFPAPAAKSLWSVTVFTLNILGAIPGPCIISGVARMMIGAYQICDKGIDFWQVGFIARGAIEAFIPGSGILLLIADVFVTLGRESALHILHIVPE